jgi:hypothetical protein
VEGGRWKIIALVAMVIANLVAGAAVGRGGGSQPRPEMEGVERRCIIAMAKSQACWREMKK